MGRLAFSTAKNRTKFLLLLLALEIVVLSYISPYFLSLGNLLQTTQSGAGLTLLSLGKALVMAGGKDGIDISTGSTTNLSGVIFGLTVMGGVSILVATVISLAAGVALGAVNGVLIAMAGVPALTAILGTQYVYGSLALYLTGGISTSGFPESFEWFSLKSTFGMPNQILSVVIPVIILVSILAYKMKFGRCAYLMGTNLEATKLTGVREVRIRIGICILAGVLAAINTVINNSWLMMVRADVGTGMEMQAITVAVLGDISVAGGSGHLSGAPVGAIIITIMDFGLQIANINSVWQLAVLGLILILAVTLDHMMNKLVIRVKKNRE